MLNRELSHFAENNKSGAQISDYLYSTYTGKGIFDQTLQAAGELISSSSLSVRQERARC